MPTNTSFLRSIGPTTWEIHISPHGVVATIEGSVALVALDTQGQTIGTDIDRINLARRVASGELDNDFRFEIFANPEPDDPASMYFVTEIATPSQTVIDRFGTDRPYDAVEAAREVQAIPDMEERWAMYAERGW